MIKKLFLMASCLAPLICPAVEVNSFENFKPIYLQENTESLRKATDKYLHFIDQISQGENFPQMEAAAEILSPNCKKVLNGQLFTQNRDDFVTDLLSVYANQGSWKVYPADIIIDSSNNTVVLRIFIEMKNSGKYTAIVILRYDSDYLITEINEVLNQVKGSYDFSNSPIKQIKKRPHYFDFRTGN